MLYLLDNLHVIPTLNFLKQLLLKSHKSIAMINKLVQHRMAKKLVHIKEHVKRDGEQYSLKKKIVQIHDLYTHHSPNHNPTKLICQTGQSQQMKLVIRMKLSVRVTGHVQITAG